MAGSLITNYDDQARDRASLLEGKRIDEALVNLWASSYASRGIIVPPSAMRGLRDFITSGNTQDKDLAMGQIDTPRLALAQQILEKLKKIV